MKFRANSNKRELDLNITPLIDIVFLLLIFFMVSTNFNKVTQVSLSLPKVSNDYNKEMPESLNLKITKTGSFFINDISVSNNDKKTLTNAIVKLVGSNRDIPFVIMGDGNAPHQSLVSALDAAGELGFKQVRIAAIKS